MTDQYYKIVYDDPPPTKNYRYEEIEDYKEPTKEEMIAIIEQLYSTAYFHLTETRTRPIPHDLLVWFEKIKKQIDNSNITSEHIRWHQYPQFKKIPKSEMERQLQWKFDYEQRDRETNKS